MRLESRPSSRDSLPAWKRSGDSLLRFLVFLSLLVSFPANASTAQAESKYQDSKVQAVLASMSPEERVGQLFLVTFEGTNTSPESQIYDLIANHHVGGVVLLRENDNFLGEPDTLPAAYQLINSLQNIEAQGDITTPQPNEIPRTGDNIYVPLFIGISQEGDGTPHDQILSGLTPLPSEMAVGATWKTNQAQVVGSVLGRELSTLGFNLLLGPLLDVTEEPNPSAQIDLGSRVFGGDPYWVGEMGKAFIAGVHIGSEARMITVAKHFPGRGSSDRSPEEEVATVRKSLEQLKQIELSPFFAVTQSTEVPNSLTDGLLVSHIRYQGFQGNIRATTRPVSLDASALAAILALPEFTAWRANGGLMVSEALGSQAVRDFYTQGGENFQARSVARDALVAGNDLLYLGNIAMREADTEDDNYAATVKILEFFTQEYENDPEFARLVDAAVARILAKKFEMYDLFTLSNVLVPQERLATIGASRPAMFEVARNSATLISPGPEELNTLIPANPGQNDRIVFLTDAQTNLQCSLCVPQDAFSTFALEDMVERLYGPTGSGQIIPNRLSSYPFTELELMLNGESEENIEPALENANWIVISLTDVSNGQIQLLRRFFTERPNLVRNKIVVLFSFTAPYYLDATDISKLNAYYGLYSKQPAFVEVAARLLFQQIALQGASPVSIPAVNYDLISATSPDPDQVIPLELDTGNVAETPTAEVTPVTAEPTEIPLYRIGDEIAVRAGPILDTNQHVVPDRTVVVFTMSTMEQGGGILERVEATTTDGIAQASFDIDTPGKVEISAASYPAMTSVVLQFDASDQGAAVTIVAPTVSPTVVIDTPTLTPVPENDLISPDGHPRIGVWMIVLIALFGSAVLTYWAASRIFSPRWGLRWALCVFLGGLLGYNYLALDFPGAAEWVAVQSGAYGVLLLVLMGEVAGLLIAFIWMIWVSGQESRAS